jgi:site-specific DNA recombinase
VSRALAPATAPRAVAIYIRWSTDEQTDGTTLETQRERCSLYIKSQGWTPSEDLEFVDDGYSGGTLERPALTRLREYIRAGKVDCVVAYSIDRLSRNLADITELIQREWAGRCTFRSATQPIGTDEGNPTGQLVFNILASFAEFERGLIRERTYSGSIRRAKEGKVPGGRRPPFGYDRVGVGQLAINETQAVIVRQIFEWAVTGPYGQGPNVIARRLNEQGIPSPAGKRWWSMAVRDLLHNPIYCGTVTFGRRKYNGVHRHDKNHPLRVKREKPLVVVEDAAPAIVSKEVWEQVQALEKDRSETYTKKGVQAKNRGLLTGLLLCRCGGPLHRFYKQGKLEYYRCSRNAQAGGCIEQPGIYRAKELEQLVVDEVMKRYGTRDLREGAMRKVEEVLSGVSRRQEYEATLEQIALRLKQVEGDLTRLRRAARTGEIQLSTYEELKEDADAERLDLEAQRQVLEISLSQNRDTSAALDAWKKTLEGVDLWSQLEPGRQREVLFGLIRSIEVYRRRGDTQPVSVSFTWESPVTL